MDNAHLPPDEARRQAFGYTCRACSRCCQHKVIQVNPYEIARLARRLGITTTEFRARFTDHGAHLRRTDDTNTCVFLGPQGCRVHPDRPLVCRLYPLGRDQIPGGLEAWIEVEPHPQSAGEYHGRGTIADYLDAQGAGPFLAAADGYVEWVRQAAACLSDPAQAGDAVNTDLADMDAAIAADCAARAVAEPGDLEARRLLHLDILHRSLKPSQGD